MCLNVARESAYTDQTENKRSERPQIQDRAERKPAGDREKVILRYPFPLHLGFDVFERLPMRKFPTLYLLESRNDLARESAYTDQTENKRSERPQIQDRAERKPAGDRNRLNRAARGAGANKPIHC
jgi:hypothetical protein